MTFWVLIQIRKRQTERYLVTVVVYRPAELFSYLFEPYEFIYQIGSIVQSLSPIFFCAFEGNAL